MNMYLESMLGNPVCSLIIRELVKTKVNWEKRETASFYKFYTEH